MKSKGVFAALALAAALFSFTAEAKEPRPGLFLRSGQAYIFRVENGQPVDVRPAAADEAPQDGELKAEMSARGGTTLMVTNRSGAALNYEAYIAKDEFERGQRTSVCTLLSGPFAIEQWPERLRGIRITNFVPAGDGMVCR